MTLALGLLGYTLLVIAAALVSPVLGIAAAGVVCLYLAYANLPPRRG
jgi:hypothetical protein